jgi:DNA gyrase subunit B
MSADPVVVDHFTARAAHYDRSSRWCTDPELAARVWGLTAPAPDARVIDLACGTGLVSQIFHGRVAEVVGVDVTPAMYAQAAPHLDRFVEAPGEALPFPDASFDLAVCRQGLQFMDDARALAELLRVLKPGGQLCLIHLCAYGEDDRAEYFEVLRLRNPARRNFYLREDLARLLREAGARHIAVHDHVSVEDVDVWSDNRAIDEGHREAIRAVYRNASPAFRERHAVQISEDGRIVDHMLFAVVVARR